MLLLGLIGVVWSILFMFLITDSPKAHRFIGENEKEYLIDETKKAVAAKEKGLVILHSYLNCLWRKYL